jgi:hypothetical protein
MKNRESEPIGALHTAMHHARDIFAVSLRTSLPGR